ncbi:conserved hypothetical protein [Histoplasma capsulatum G186AR]|uniref:Uncharacterized protein n=1 Tax=Ajellomyces capsulatus (strain G186AR / H82 / ATCC MYA-2454 / RMSCC 2432) TaxID=447093 RepID=C0P105_AJECG|nr:uncharacterized protein HCBG_09085 [Histoplasma capsulatum G186AR]EEH02641.1 conserved hypothetical protein [Histoplasma capsulatum G186AR]QSS70953.1 hypothetical protein I7I50_01624 [Histoplasma capsulatum G186AR]
MAITAPTEIGEVLSVTTRNESVSRKRKATPSPELSSPRKCLILSPSGVVASGSTIIRLGDVPLFAPSRRLFPSGEAIIANRSPAETMHAQPNSPESSTPAFQFPLSRHIVLPFNLRQNRDFGENSKLLFQLFPETKAVSFDGYFLVFWLGTLPPKPWPTTIAGVQPYFTTDPNDEGPTPPIKRKSKSRLRVAAEIDATKLQPDKIDGAFQLVFDFFSKSEISITEVQYWKHFFVIVLENEASYLAEIPSVIGRCSCFYLFEKEMGRPNPDEYPARWIRDPTGETVDNCEYDILRPGVMLSSGRHPTTHLEYHTTSGVLVEDCLGKQYMTVSSHGFPNGGRVFHPFEGAKDIGQIIMELSHTDIALVKLHDGVNFENETFESPLSVATPTRLKEFVLANNTQIGSEIYMNNPYLGYSEGTCGPHVRMHVPNDDPNEPEKLQWIKARWLYLGQGFIDHLEDGICGSAIWNDDGNVIGFFRYAPRSGHFRDWCCAVAADNVIDRGFKIAG